MIGPPIASSHDDADHRGGGGRGSGFGNLEVPRLGFGAMRLPGPGVWGPPTDRDEAIRTVRRAVELGVRVIDSAWYYGLDVANEVIAAAIRPYPDDLVLVTKLGGARTDDGTWVSGLTPEALRAGCERDLRVLGIDAVPVVHLRWIENAGISTAISFNEALDVMLSPAGAGQDPAHRPVERHRRTAIGGVGADPDRERLESLRPGRTVGRCDARFVHRQRYGVPPLLSAGSGPGGDRDRQCARRGRGQARRDAGSGCDRVAARAFTGDAADPGYEQGGHTAGHWPRPR